MKVLVKVCGLTGVEEARMLVEEKVDMGGVEYEDTEEIVKKGYRKDRGKIREFVRRVKNYG